MISVQLKLDEVTIRSVMQIFIRYLLEQRLSQYRGVFAGKLISEVDTPHANTTPTRKTTTYFTVS